MDLYLLCIQDLDGSQKSLADFYFNVYRRIATLLHLVDFYRAIDDIQWTSHLAVAIKMAKTLGFQLDVDDVIWTGKP